MMSNPTTNQRSLQPQRQQKANRVIKPVNLLILNLSPRKIKVFEHKLNILNQKYDILRIKNDFVEVRAYEKARKYFLEHPEYTHAAILPDDLLVDLRHVEQLIRDIEQYDYPVLSGICNFALSTKAFFENMGAIEYANYGAVDLISRTGRFDYFKQIMSRKRYKEIKEQMKNKPNRIIRVALSAFPFTIIRRDVLEKIEFGANLMGVDTVFFQSLINKGIPAYADLDVEMLHIKGIEKNHEMKNSTVMAFDRNISTEVNMSAFNPPPMDEIFLPKIHQDTQ